MISLYSSCCKKSEGVVKSISSYKLSAKKMHELLKKFVNHFFPKPIHNQALHMSMGSLILCLYHYFTTSFLAFILELITLIRERLFVSGIIRMFLLLLCLFIMSNIVEIS